MKTDELEEKKEGFEEMLSKLASKHQEIKSGSIDMENI